MGREGHCRPISLACVGSTHSVPATRALPPLTACLGSTRSVPATRALPPLTGVCFPRLHCSGSWLLYREWALRCVQFQFLGTPQRRRLGWVCVLCLPWPEQLRHPGAYGRTLPCGVHLIPSAAPASVSVQAGLVRLVSVLRSCPPAATLSTDVNHPESQEIFGYKLGACLQFGRGGRLWGRVFPFPLPPCLLPPAGDGDGPGWARPQPASSSLELLSLSFVLQTGRQCVQLVLFDG